MIITVSVSTLGALPSWSHLIPTSSSNFTDEENEDEIEKNDLSKVMQMVNGTAGIWAPKSI